MTAEEFAEELKSRLEDRLSEATQDADLEFRAPNRNLFEYRFFYGECTGIEECIRMLDDLIEEATR